MGFHAVWRHLNLCFGNSSFHAAGVPAANPPCEDITNPCHKAAMSGKGHAPSDTMVVIFLKLSIF